MKHRFLPSLLLAFAPLLFSSSADAQILFNGSYNQDFNGLNNSGTANVWSDNTTLLGWYASNSSGALSTYTGNGGGGSPSGLYSWGSAAGERALGIVAGTGNTLTYGFRLTNNTASSISALSISFTGEQWYRGVNIGSAISTSLFASYSTNATSITSGTYTPYSALNFTGPVQTNTTAGTGAAINGNTNSVGFSNVVLNISGGWAPGTDLWIRWQDPLQVSGTGFRDNGLSIDALSIGIVPEPSSVGLLALGLAGFVLRFRRRSAL